MEGRANAKKPIPSQEWQFLSHSVHERQPGPGQVTQASRVGRSHACPRLGPALARARARALKLRSWQLRL
eukprot:9247231-Alexandrium_andersonii.AAC.1